LQPESEDFLDPPKPFQAKADM